MLYTSRSAIESGSVGYGCLRRRWLEYFYKGRGIRQAQANIPLTTGTCVHEGIAFLMRNVMNGLIPSVEQHYLAYESNWLDSACNIALQSYRKIVGESGLETEFFNGQQSQRFDDDIQTNFVFAQECARTEALIRAWSIAELPQLVKHYNVYSVEDEIVAELAPGVMFQARVDAILQSKDDGSMFNYSLKTMKDYREREGRDGRINPLNTDAKFAIALQTQTEAWAAEQYLKQRSETINSFLRLADRKINEEGKFQTLNKFVAKYLPATTGKIYGTKHCFLIKGGKAKEGEYGNIIAGDSPLIRAYCKTDGDTSIYCHSYYIPNTNNRSGKGTIGKTFESFNVWERMTIKDWIALLNSKVQDHTGQMIPEIQPECGDIIKQQVITPAESFVKREELETCIIQITAAEKNVRENEEWLNADSYTYGGLIDDTFPMNRSECYSMGVCQFLPICHLKDWKGDSVNKQVREDPIGSGLFVWREPHHKAEAEYVTIQSNTKGI